MIADVTALAKDVDRLYRARLDGRQMPVGDVSREDGRWTPEASEAAAYRMAGILDGLRGSASEQSCKYFWTAQGDFKCFTNQRKRLRTRRHVSVMALTEPEHFERCLAEADAVDERHMPRWSSARIKIVRQHTALGFGLFRFEDYPRSREKADVARTAAYLQDLDARLTEYREAEARQAAIKAGRLADAEPPQVEAEPMDRLDEDAVLEID